MGVTLDTIRHIFDGKQSDGTRFVADGPVHVLDVGCSNIHTLQADTILNFVVSRTDRYDPQSLRHWAEYVEMGGVMDPRIGGTNGAWLGDILDRAGMTYKAFDIFPGFKTELFDLNTQDLPAAEKGAYDVVLNFGTTEHVLSQFNAFKVIHEAMAVGGIVVHELPMTGHLNHGFVNYNPVLLHSLAEANGYEILEMRLEGAIGTETIGERLVAIYKAYPFFIESVDHDGWAKQIVPTASIRMIARKVRDTPFRTSLETTTTAGTVDDSIGQNYGSEKSNALSSRDKVIAKISVMYEHALAGKLKAEELNAYLKEFTSGAPTDAFPQPLELILLDDYLKSHEDATIEARRKFVLTGCIATYPLLAYIDKARGLGGALSVNKVIASLRKLPVGRRFEGILEAYAAYWTSYAVELFPEDLELEALVHLRREGGNEPALLLRLGKLLSRATPDMKIAEKPKAPAPVS